MFYSLRVFSGQVSLSHAHVYSHIHPGGTGYEQHGAHQHADAAHHTLTHRVHHGISRKVSE